MQLLLPIGVAIRAWQSAASLLGRPAVWLPFLLIGAAQALSLMLFGGFHHSAVLPVALPLVELLGGKEATHYPLLYFALPMMFTRANLAINIVVASLAGGVATVLFARAFGSNPVDRPWTRTARRWLALALVAGLSTGLVLGVTELVRLIPQETLRNVQWARWGARALEFFLFVLLQCLFAYATAWIVLRGHGLWSALRDSFRVALRTFLPTLIVIGLPALLIYPFSYATSRVDVVASRFRPEVIPALIGVQLLFELVATFVVVGAITRLFLWRMETTR